MKAWAYFLLYPLVVLTGIFTASGEEKVYEGLTVRHYPWSMAALHYPRTPGGDSVYATPYGETWYYNIDSLCYHMATDRNSQSTKNLMHYHFWSIPTYASPRQMDDAYRKMKAAALHYHCPALSKEADYRKTCTSLYTLLTTRDAISNDELDHVLDNIEAYSQQRPSQGKSAALAALCDSYRISRLVDRRHRSFLYVPLLLELLQEVPFEDSPDYYYLYYCIGSDYYRLGDKQQGLAYLRKALHDTPIRFSDRSDLRARTTLAGYYAERNLLDSADYYYRSLYDSPQQVRFRPVYDVVAAGGIAETLVKRGRYDQALALLARWIPEAERQNILSERFHMYLAAGKCHLAAHRYTAASHTIDSLRALMQQFQTTDLLMEIVPADNLPTEDFYGLVSEYYSLTNHPNMALQYLDSMWMEEKRRRETHTPLVILRVEQQTFHARKEFFQQLAHTYAANKNYLLMLLALLAVALLVLAVLYRKKQEAYRQLVEKGHEWAGRATLEERASHEEYDIVRRAHEKMSAGLFKDCRLTLESLAAELDVHRNVLSRAINRVTGKRFNRFVNEYRIKEAIRRIENAPRDNKNLYIDGLYEELGFNSRTSFFRTFKQMVGLPPCAFFRQQGEGR